VSCQKNFFSQTGSSACTACAAGSFTDGEGFSSCKQCDAGFFYEDDTCKVCPKNTISRSSGQIQCDACSQGRYTENIGATLCINCGFGTFRGQQQDSCVQCPQNMYAERNASVVCTLCPVGTHQPVVGSTGCIACTGGATNVEPGTSCNLKPIVNSEASLILSPATYGLYMSASFGLFWYYRIGINSLLVMALIIIDSVGNIIYFLIEPFLYSFLGAAYAFFSFLTVLCLVGHDLNVLLGPFPLYIWAKSTSDAILAPSKKLLSLQEWNMVDGNGKFKILLRCFGGLFIGLLPFIASSILIGFAALVFSLRNIKVIICGLAVYSTFAIVVRPVENWFCETIMSQAPPGSYLMNVENHEPYTRRIIQIYSTHLLVQNLPCLFLLGLNAMSFKSLSGFGYFKLGVAVIVALYGLYFVLAYNQTCSRCLNKKSENKDTEIVKVKVHTSAVAQDETTTPPPPEDAFSKPSPDDDDDDPQHKHLKKRLSPKTSKADLMKDVKKKNPETTDSKDDPNRSSTKKPEESNKPKASKKAAAAGDDAKSNNSVKKSGT
jgi:hypothetical protein